jgi:DNA sulfur modification protein DndB
VYKGEDGITPAITLFTQAPLDVDERDDGTCFLQVPWEERLVAIDGETQLAARHEASNIEPATRQEFIPVYICYGRDLQWARQSFHDLNTLGVKPNTALSIGMDARDPVTKICRDVERHVRFFNGKVNKQRRQLKTTDQDVVTITTLRGACVTIAKGINGVQYGSRPVDVDDATLNSVRSAAVDWFDAIAEAIGPAMEDREHKLASTSAVMAAIGAIGHQLVGIGDDEVRRERARILAEDLKSVNWERGKRWEGIAGKYTPKGVFSVGGAKENAYAVYSALTDSSTDGYKRVRPSLATAA